jgi:hypothetical protein
VCKFDVGDLVKVVKIPTEWSGYVPILDEYYHKVGVIVIKSPTGFGNDAYVYRVDFNGICWCFPAESLELVPQTPLDPGNLSALFGK